MKKLILALSLCMIPIMFGCQKEKVLPTETIEQDNTISRLSAMPVYSHIFVIWMENKTYSSIVGRSAAPYINQLISQGTLFTNYYGLQNPSQPNYIGTFAGTRCGISDNNDPLNGSTTPRLTQLNLYTQLNAVGKTFFTYAEGLPSVGSMIWSTGRYRGRHDPSRNFANVNQTSRKPFTSIPTNLNTTATVNFLIPNNDHNMHDQSISYGDNWLKTDPQIQSIINYCKNPINNSLFILYWDEGTTTDNRIAVTFVGNRVKVNAKVSTSYNHYNLTHTILSMYGATQVNTAATYADLAGWYN